MTNAAIVYAITAKIPKGKVLSYGNLAVLAGIRNPRVVGNILHNNNDPKHVPCHRVVNSLGRLAPHYAFGGDAMQESKLHQEGVRFIGNRVSLQESLWKPTLQELKEISALRKKA